MICFRHLCFVGNNKIIDYYIISQFSYNVPDVIDLIIRGVHLAHQPYDSGWFFMG